MFLWRNSIKSQVGRGWMVFDERNRIPQLFRRVRICKFLQLRKKWAVFGCNYVGAIEELKIYHIESKSLLP